MIARVFHATDSQDKALRRLGMAVVLRWTTFPAVVQEAIALQALATSDDDARVHETIETLLNLAKGETSVG